VQGVKEYRDDFEPNADDLITKFTEISEVGYDAFIKYAVSDVNVKNAVINGGPVQVGTQLPHSLKAPGFNT
jgi:hypothetical protein